MLKVSITYAHYSCAGARRKRNGSATSRRDLRFWREGGAAAV